MSMRTERLGGVIREELAAMLMRGEIKEPRLTSLVSISAVEVTGDLQLATIYFSVMGDEGGNQACLEAFNRASGFIRGRLAKRLRVRLMPDLRFRVDDSIAQGAHMNRLLASLNIPPADSSDREG